jgi:hypothetical protein
MICQQVRFNFRSPPRHRLGGHHPFVAIPLCAQLPFSSFGFQSGFNMFLDIPEASEPMTGDRFWARYQPFLRHRGYELRPRYQPDWQPSWRGKVKNELDAYLKYEDFMSIIVLFNFHLLIMNH